MREPRIERASAALNAGDELRKSSPADTRDAGISPIPNKNLLLAASGPGSYAIPPFHTSVCFLQPECGIELGNSAR